VQKYVAEGMDWVGEDGDITVSTYFNLGTSFGLIIPMGRIFQNI
jgi:hypothetical protein